MSVISDAAMKLRPTTALTKPRLIAKMAPSTRVSAANSNDHCMAIASTMVTPAMIAAATSRRTFGSLGCANQTNVETEKVKKEHATELERKA